MEGSSSAILIRIGVKTATTVALLIILVSRAPEKTTMRRLIKKGTFVSKGVIGIVSQAVAPVRVMASPNARPAPIMKIIPQPTPCTSSQTIIPLIAK
jgi:hypothetical protein